MTLSISERISPPFHPSERLHTDWQKGQLKRPKVHTIFRKSLDYFMRIIQVKVSPRSRESHLESLEDGSYVARLKSPPVDGKANAELISLVSKQFGVPKSAVTIKSGAGARLKLVAIVE